MGYGITPDFLVLRADMEIPDDVCEKIARATGIRNSHVIPAPTASSIYRVPLDFETFRLSEKLAESLRLPKRPCHLEDWETLVENISASVETLDLGMIGKYNDLEDAYYSLNE